jgi:5-methylcytosine-specific restriction protein A
MPLRETLQTILADYPKAKSEPLESHALAQFIRGEAEDAVQQALGELGAGLLVEGSPGQGNWAAVPWISVFDPAITTSATRGYYVVYLFHAHEPVVHLSLNQGTTAVREEFAGKAREVLADRAEFMRKRVAEYGTLLPVQTIELGSNARLPGDYVAGHALGTSYTLDALPTEAALRTDLQNVVRAYRALTFRGGIEGDVEPQAELADEFKIPAQATIIETRKYAFHRKVERNPTAAKQAKKFHGSAARRVTSILKSVMAKSAKVLLKRTISSRYQRSRRGSRLLMTWRPTLQCSAPTVIA